MQDGNLFPTESAGGAGRKSGLEIWSDGEERANNVIGIERIGGHEGAKQLLRGGEDLRGFIAFDGGGAPKAMEAGRRSGRHGGESSATPSSHARHR